jgi:tetratricopeptide (TPR) repeat protein
LINIQSEPKKKPFYDSHQAKARERILLFSLALFLTSSSPLPCRAKEELPDAPTAPVSPAIPGATADSAKPAALAAPESAQPAKTPGTSQLSLGREAFLAGNYNQALEIFSNFEKEQPANLAVHYWLGCVYQELGNLNEAHRHYAACVKLANSINVDSPHLRINLGNMLASWGNLKDAKFDYERAIELDPLVPEAYLGISKCLIQEGNFKQALGAVDRYKQEGGEDQSQLLVRGLALAGLGRLSEAQKLLTDFLSLPPNGNKPLVHEKNLALARQILTQINQIQGLPQP